MDALDRDSPQPRARVRVRIDARLEAAGYLLVADGEVCGSIEPKPEAHTPASVEVQTDRYNTGFKQLVATKPLPRYADELLFHWATSPS